MHFSSEVLTLNRREKTQSHIKDQLRKNREVIAKIKTFMHIAKLSKALSEEAMGTNMVQLFSQREENQFISINSTCAAAAKIS